MADHLVKQGRYGNFPERCGTDGLGTCVGVAVNVGGGRWFVAHIDCATRGLRPLKARISAWVRERMQTLLGPHADRVVHVVTPGGDHSADAIVEGIVAWRGGAVTSRSDFSGFVIDGGAVQALGAGLENGEDGEGGFSVPNLEIAAPAGAGGGGDG
ncbi:MAG: hypothetical protein NBV67_03210 [Tagaea sp.]|nr:hypothetical protein [Tagaea sp.]